MPRPSLHTTLAALVAGVRGSSAPVAGRAAGTLGTADAARLGLRLTQNMAVGTAAGIGVLVGVGAAGWATLMRQAKTAARIIETAALDAAQADGNLPEGAGFVWQVIPPDGDGVYLPDGSGPHPVTAASGGTDPVILSMLGDSTSVGYGCTSSDEVPGVVLARGLAAAIDRPVRVVTHGLVGSGASDLARQVGGALPDRPDVVVIVVGANDVRDKVPPRHSANLLGDAVAALRAQGIPVVVGSCPDLGVVTPIPQPLRSVVRTWSRRLAAFQERAVVAAGGRAVPIARLVSPEFRGRPDLFAPDHFHPSGPGYARAAAALLPVVVRALADDTAVAATHKVAADATDDPPPAQPNPRSDARSSNTAATSDDETPTRSASAAKTAS